MPSLKDYRDRIASVKSTKKITSAMKMVAASKLKKAQDAAQASQPYAQSMASMLTRVADGVTSSSSGPKLLTGTGRDQLHLLVVVSSDRGLCGGFNGNLLRYTRNQIAMLKAAGKDVKIVTVGRKSYESLRRDYSDSIVRSYSDVGNVDFSLAHKVSSLLLGLLEREEFDVCSLVYNDFRSVLAQVPSSQQLIPFATADVAATNDNATDDGSSNADEAPYDFEPDEEKILEDLLPRNLSIQIFRALLDSAAGEQAARMTAMDNATRNAGDVIKRITLEYNRARQAAITKELIEIISGAEAV
jgi:F-type H+-transporting ATPase subunit gamma